TKAEDVAEIWPRIIRRYPRVANLAGADRRVLLSLLKPLGLQRQRTAALIAVARALVQSHSGEVPRTIPGLLSLPHVGLYVATAVACFAFKQRVPIVDANVVRVFERITGTCGVRDIRRRSDIWRLAWATLPTNAARHNYGLLDFAATTCMPRMPRCRRCSL